MRQKVFFSSIPKCGKNLLYSLFHGLGYERYFPQGELYAEAAYAEAFDGVNYAYPARGEAFPADVLDGFAGELASMKPGMVFHRHLLPRPEFRAMLQAAEVKPLFVVRDPRDAVVSAGNYALSQKKPVQIVERLGDRDLPGILRFLLRGEGGTEPFLTQFEAFYGWAEWPEVLVVRFEDLIGAAGGGSAERQRATLAAIMAHVGDGDADLDRAAESVFNPRAGTFFKGQIGSHRTVLTGDLADLFESRFGALLDLWGYR